MPPGSRLPAHVSFLLHDAEVASTMLIDMKLNIKLKIVICTSVAAHP